MIASADIVPIAHLKTAVQESAYYVASKTAEQSSADGHLPNDTTVQVNDDPLDQAKAVNADTESFYSVSFGTDWTNVKAKRLESLLVLYATKRINAEQLLELVKLRRLARQYKPLRSGSEYVAAMRQREATAELTRALEKYVRVVRPAG